MRRIFAALAPPRQPAPTDGPQIPEPDLRALLGFLGALIAGLSSYLNQFDTNFARADLYGGLGLGQDVGSWVTVAFNCGSVSIVVLTAWLSSIVSPRRAIAGFLILQTLAAVAVPTVTSYPAIVALAFLHGVGGGGLVPLLFIVVFRILPPHQRLWGFAAYAAVVALSPLTGELVGGYLKHYIGWQAIFWECLVLNPIALVLVLVGLPVEPLKLERFGKDADYLGMALFTAFGTTLTAALVVGQRFDWFSSPVIVTLFVLAGTFLVLFIWQELVIEAPLINLRLLKRRNLALGLAVIVLFFFAVEGVGYVLPNYGTQIRGFREIQIGDILLWGTLPVVVLAPLVAWLLHYLDARVVAAFGFLVIVIAEHSATYLTSNWVEHQFLFSQVLAACGYPIVLVCDLQINVSALKPEDALSGSALFNTVRVLASNIGAAIVGGIAIVRERVHSNIIASDATTGAFRTVHREAIGGGLAGLTSEVHEQAFVMAYADTFGWIAMVVIAGMVLLLFVGDSPVPLPPRSKKPDQGERDVPYQRPRTSS